ncbi:type I secretion system permease/ATPase, partial [Staphylococcus warneri]
MLAPISQVTGVLGRWQQAKVAKNGLDELMQKPVDRPERAQLIQRKVLLGDYDFKGVVFKYTEDDPRPTLVIPQLKIAVGEKV